MDRFLLKTSAKIDRRRSHLLCLILPLDRTFSELVSFVKDCRKKKKYKLIKEVFRWKKLKYLKYLLHLLPANFTNECIKYFINVATKSSRSFIKGTTKLHCKCFSLLRWHFALWIEIELVCDKHEWNVLGKSHACNQFPILGSLLKAVTIANAVANYEAFAASKWENLFLAFKENQWKIVQSYFIEVEILYWNLSSQKANLILKHI